MLTTVFITDSLITHSLNIALPKNVISIPPLNTSLGLFIAIEKEDEEYIMSKELSSLSFSNTSKSFPCLKKCDDTSCACDDVDVKDIGTDGSDDEINGLPEIHEKKKSLWESILEESKERAAPYVEWLKEREETATEKIDSPANYLSREIFPTLLPAMEETLRQARSWNALVGQKGRFNGLDHLAEYLWNKNPRWPHRNLNWLNVFDIPQFKLCMRLNPRPIYPKSWLWLDNEAAVYIQRWVRGWLVRKREDVQELRLFWKALKNDSGNLDDNLAKTNSPISDICSRYKLLAKKRQKPF